MSALGYQIVERKVLKEDINRAKEAFITSTTKNIMPVIAVDGRLINNGSVGEVTRSLQKDLKRIIFQDNPAG